MSATTPGTRRAQRAIGPHIHSKPGTLIELVSYTLTKDGYEPTIRYGRYLGSTETHIRISEDGNDVALDRRYWLEALS